MEQSQLFNLILKLMDISFLDIYGIESVKESKGDELVIDWALHGDDFYTTFLRIPDVVYLKPTVLRYTNKGKSYLTELGVLNNTSFFDLILWWHRIQVDQSEQPRKIKRADQDRAVSLGLSYLSNARDKHSRPYMRYIELRTALAYFFSITPWRKTMSFDLACYGRATTIHTIEVGGFDELLLELIKKAVRWNAFENMALLKDRSHNFLSKYKVMSAAYRRMAKGHFRFIIDRYTFVAHLPGGGFISLWWNFRSVPEVPNMDSFHEVLSQLGRELAHVGNAFLQKSVIGESLPRATYPPYNRFNYFKKYPRITLNVDIRDSSRFHSNKLLGVILENQNGDPFHHFPAWERFQKLVADDKDNVSSGADPLIWEIARDIYADHQRNLRAANEAKTSRRAVSAVDFHTRQSNAPSTDVVCLEARRFTFTHVANLRREKPGRRLWSRGERVY